MIEKLKLKSKLDKFAKKHRIKFIVLFGSQAKERPKEGSDFDIAIFLENKKSIFSDLNLYSIILNELSKLLRINQDKIDLTNLNKANILLRYEITSGGKLLYGNEDEYAQFRAFASREYIDAKPLFNLESFLIKKRQKLIKEAISK
jgi:predicted nucleotidyltransferase